ncbi:hypothetical protein VNO77_23298 [Canavalia gladiata]|uniref:Uncharacterized protein n=1 Tax=Canavalia gladiata TaxID=3824 RepID=A0AAN9QBD8_CANGL
MKSDDDPPQDPPGNEATINNSKIIDNPNKIQGLDFAKSHKVPSQNKRNPHEFKANKRKLTCNEEKKWLKIRTWNTSEAVTREYKILNVDYKPVTGDGVLVPEAPPTVYIMCGANDNGVSPTIDANLQELRSSPMLGSSTSKRDRDKYIYVGSGI